MIHIDLLAVLSIAGFLFGIVLIYLGIREGFGWDDSRQGDVLFIFGIFFAAPTGLYIGSFLLECIPGGLILIDWLKQLYIFCSGILDHLPRGVSNGVLLVMVMVVFYLLQWYWKRLIQTPSQRHLNEALALVKQKKLDQAIAQFDLCIGLEPGNDEALMWRGDMHMSLNQYEKAVDDYTKLLSPGTQIGKSHRGQENLSPLVTQNLIRSLHYNRGCCLAKLGKTEQALDDFTKAISVRNSSSMKHNLMVEEPNCAELYRARAELYERLGKLDLAKKDREKAFEMRSKDA